MIRYLIDRLQCCEALSSIAVATSTEPSDDAILRFCIEQDLKCVRGELDKVLTRLLGAAEQTGASAFLRISADSPLIDPKVVDEAIWLFEAGEFDIVTNVFPRSFPKGQSVEVISVASLRRVSTETSNAYDLEHVTPFIYGNPAKFRIRNFSCQKDLSAIQMSVDSESDFQAFASLVGRMTKPHWQYSLDDLLALREDAAPQGAR
jgi:spore coat polysaccharide biosynthesis protein SpsF